MSPIQWGTWAQLWVLGLTLHSGGGLRLQTERGIFRAQWIPAAAFRLGGQRSGLSWEDPRVQVHLGQTPLGPGHSLHRTSSIGGFLAYVGPDFRWFQWTGQPGHVFSQASWSSQGLRLEGQWARWSYGLAPQGLSYLGWQGLQTQARMRLAPGRWESMLRVYRAQFILSGNPSWSSSRLRFEHRGRYVEFSEMHSKRGLHLQTLGRLPWREHSLSFSVAPAPWPSWIAYHYRGRKGLSGHMQWSDRAMFRRWSIGLPLERHQGWVGVGQNVAGPHVEIRWKGVEATYRRGQGSLRIHHTWTWRRTSPRTFIETPSAPPQLHILTHGEVDHPVLPLHVLDSEGRRYALHLLRGSHQWKSHLPPGQYHWPTRVTRPAQGWIVEVPATTFTLEAGEIYHLPILVRKDERPVYWLPLSAEDTTEGSPSR